MRRYALRLYFISPLRGLVISTHVTHGLRRGLDSCAASRLKPIRFK